MKKLFNHTKKPRKGWNENEYDPGEYDWDEVAEDYESIEEYEEYNAEEYTEEIGAEDACPVEMYGEETYVEETYAEDVYEEETYAEEAYAEDVYEEETYAEEAYEEGVYAEEAYVEESYIEDDAEPVYEEENYEEYTDAVDYDAVPVQTAASVKKKKKNDDSMIDRIMLIGGVAILLLAILVGIVFVGTRFNKETQSVFAGVGTQLKDINIIGERGLLAVADATVAKIQASQVVEEEDTTTEYDEQDYKNGGTVVLDMVSIKKDLKIKFSNKETEKLISNVPFSVSVTGPDGKILSWLDDDMDGIIYKKNIAPGKYEISVDSLNAEKYGGYVLPTSPQKVEVKEEIAYEKVDVKNEIKKESEVNASKEDTKVNETKVESVLQDTVQWVESKVIASTYVEVAKSDIPDPMKLALNGRFLRTTGYTASISGTTEMVLGSTASTTLTAAVTDSGGTAATIRAAKWTSSDTSIATVDESGKVTALKAGSATITCELTYEYSETVSGSDVEVKTATVAL